MFTSLIRTGDVWQVSPEAEQLRSEGISAIKITDLYIAPYGKGATAYVEFDYLDESGSVITSGEQERVDHFAQYTLPLLVDLKSWKSKKESKAGIPKLMGRI